MRITARNGQVFPFDQIRHAFLEMLRMQQVAHANGFFHIFIGIDRRDAAAGGAEFLVCQTIFFQDITHLVIWHADGRAVADDQVLRCDLDPLVTQHFDLIEKMFEVDDHARPHHIDGLITQNAGRQQIQDELAFFVDNGMSGVVAALITDDNIIFFAQKVDHAALAFISPVCSYNRS